MSMLKHLRMATKEEVEAIRATSNLPPEYVVYAMDQNDSDPDIAVVKRVFELDPVYFGKRTNDVQKAKFIYALEERMAGGGILQYEFNVKDSDEHWKRIILGWGAKEVSPTPERRFLKEL